MNTDAYDALVARLERHAAAHPLLYRIEVVALAMIGYGYLLALLLGSVALVVAFAALAFWKPNAATIKFGLIVGGGAAFFAWAIMRSLWIRLDPPTGRELRPDEAPELFAEVERLRAQLAAPRIHRLVLTDEFNAAMAQTPRLGILGWPRNHLVLGLPLMRVLTPDELRSVIAHELGHAGGGHGTFGGWIYRIRATWSVLARQVVAGGAAKLVRGFLKFFVPRFNAWTFVLARAQEYEADRAAVAVAGARDAANALVRVNVLGRHASETFWPVLGRRAVESAVPPAHLLGDLQQSFAGIGPGQAKRWLSEAWRRPTDRVDTHPCLRERLTAMGIDTVPAPPAGVPPRTAASAFLGAAEARLTNELETTWSTSVAETWRDRHTQAHRLRDRRDDLLRRTAPSRAEQWEIIHATLELDGDEAATPALIALAELGDDQARWQVGRIRLAAGDETGLADLTAVCTRDPEAIPSSAGLAVDFLANRGRTAELRTWERLAESFADEAAQADAEREKTPAAKLLRAATLTDAQRLQVTAAVHAHAEIGHAWVARVEVAHLPHRTWHVLIIEVRIPWWKPRSSTADVTLAKAVADELHLPLAVTVYVGKSYRSLAKAAKAITGAAIE